VAETYPPRVVRLLVTAPALDECEVPPVVRDVVGPSSWWRRWCPVADGVGVEESAGTGPSSGGAPADGTVLNGSPTKPAAPNPTPMAAEANTTQRAIRANRLSMDPVWGRPG
jgi:hypothetical protein